MGRVIARLMGGLGNQMFQYAAGHALAHRLGVPLLLDRTFLDARPTGMTWTPRSFALDVFRAPIAFASAEQVRWSRKALDSSGPSLLRRWSAARAKGRAFVERAKTTDPAFFTLEAPIYLDGFWQSERYFHDVAPAIRHELFVPKEAPSAQNARLADAIAEGTSASLHVRRGDYVTNASAGAFHGTCSVEYYRAAAAELAGTHGVDRFFLFSDDPEWVREHLRLPHAVTHVHHNTGADAHWDLWLMRRCRHHIIANSSFSWWGAWLDDRPGNVVIAPGRWFAQDLPNDIVPPEWLKR